MENLPKHAWILCVRHNLLLAELCALRARCLLFQMLSIIVSTPSGSFKADRLYLFLLIFTFPFIPHFHLLSVPVSSFTLIFLILIFAFPFMPGHNFKALSCTPTYLSLQFLHINFRVVFPLAFISRTTTLPFRSGK